MQIEVGQQYLTRSGKLAAILKEVTPNGFIKATDRRFVVSVGGKLHWCYHQGSYLCTGWEHPLDLLEET
jgi:hypothetical protein